MPVFVGVHGAWSGGWAWWRMHSLFLGKGIRFVMPTCTGLGERAHLLNPGIDLNTHIEDIVQVIEHEDLSDVVLVGHSYGGMVATGVAARVANRIRRLITSMRCFRSPASVRSTSCHGYRVGACWKPRSRRDSGG